MEIPKWSGDSHRFARYRIRVFWFRLLFASALVAVGFALSKTLQSIEFREVRDHGVQRHKKSRAVSGYRHPEPRPVGAVEIVGIKASTVNDADLEVAAALARKRSAFHLDAVPFNDFVTLFRTKSKLNVLVTREAREMIEAENYEVNLDSSDLSLKSALNLAILGRELQYHIQDGVIVISSREASAPLILHSYDVSELIYLVAKQRHERYLAEGVDDEDAEFEDEDQLCDCGMLTTEILIEFIEKSCTREDDEGSLEISGGLLWVRKSAEVHHRIERMLRALVAGIKANPVEESATPILEAQRLSSFDIECERRLAKRINLSFRDTPLSEVLEFIGEVSGLHIFTNPNIDQDEFLINLEAQQMPIDQVLRFVARDCHLTMYRAHESLIFTSKDSHEEYNRYYIELTPVSDLLKARDGTEALDADYLTEILRNSTGEDHWDDPASIDIVFGQLFIRQTQPIHKSVFRILKAMRQAKQNR